MSPQSSPDTKPVNDAYTRVYDDYDSSKDQHSAYDGFSDRVNHWIAQQKAAHIHRTQTYGPLEWIGVVIPCLNWLRRYKFKEYILGDIAAGVSIGCMVVPQGMSYAVLAGLPPEFGLYGAFVPVLIYAVFGSSPQLAVGPVAVTSILLNTGLHDIVPAADAIKDAKPKGNAQKAIQQQYNEAAIQVAFLVSIMYTAVGVFRLGFLTNFLSHSVISGFTSGAAIIIGMSQLKYFFGVKTKNTTTAIETIRELLKVVDHTNWRESIMFLAWLFLLLTIKHTAKSVKRLSWMRAIGPITVALLGIFFVKVIPDLRHQIRIVKSIPSGLPGPTVDKWKPLFNGDTRFGKQMSLAVIVMLVDFMESISIAKMLARRGKYQIAVTQEIIGLGIANFFGSMFHCYTTTGSFSRSAVSADVGSKTGLFGVFTSLVVMFVLLFLTPVFELVPYNALGAIIVSACIGLFEGREALFLYRANFLDFLVWIAAFIGTVLAGVEIGLAISIGLAILLVIYQSAFPNTAPLGRLPGTSVYRSTKQYPNAIQQKGMVIMRVDAPIYFANVEWVRTSLYNYIKEAQNEPVLLPIKFVILDLSPVPFIDATGMHAFHELVQDLKGDGMQLVLANPCSNVKLHLARMKVLEEIGKEWVFVRTADAVDVCSREIMEGSDHGLKDDGARGVAESSEAKAEESAAGMLPINWPRP